MTARIGPNAENRVIRLPLSASVMEECAPELSIGGQALRLVPSATASFLLVFDGNTHFIGRTTLVSKHSTTPAFDIS